LTSGQVSILGHKRQEKNKDFLGGLPLMWCKYSRNFKKERFGFTFQFASERQMS